MPITSTAIEAEATEVESTPEGVVAEGTTITKRSCPSVSAAGVSDGEAVGFGILTVSVVGLGASLCATVIYIVYIKRKPSSGCVDTNKLQRKQPDNELQKGHVNNADI